MIGSNLSPGPTFLASSSGFSERTLPLCRRSRSPFNRSPHPTRWRALKQQQGSWPVAVRAGQAVRRPEKEREWFARSHSSYYGYSLVQRNATGPSGVLMLLRKRLPTSFHGH